MPRGFRESMDWLHTWTGLLFGTLLFIVFLMGTLSVFDRELDRWSQPASRRAAAPARPVSLDLALAEVRRLAPEQARNWLVYLPTDRVPTTRIGWSGGGASFQVRDLGADGVARPAQGGAFGTGFAFPMHFSLHWKWLDFGYWLVGAAAMALMVAIVSGVATHRRIFKDFFTFRPAKPLQRSALDLHNWTAVLAMPFHFLIALSGLAIFLSIYLPAGIAAAYGDDKARFSRESYSTAIRPVSGKPLEGVASVDAMLAESRRRWQARSEPGEAWLVIVRNGHDAAATVDVRRDYRERVSLITSSMWFDAGSGALIHEERLGPVRRAERWLAGLHFIQFRHWPLRWLYFVLGTAGCAMLLTGTLVWSEKRAERHAREGKPGARLVEAINVAATLGLIVATLAMLCANRLLPAGLADPLAIEMGVFFAVWGAGLVHAVVAGRSATPRRHWRQQTLAASALALAAVMLNALTTGDHLLRTLSTGDWAVAGVDLGLLVTAAVTAWAATRLRAGAVQHRPAVAKEYGDAASSWAR